MIDNTLKLAREEELSQNKRKKAMEQHAIITWPDLNKFGLHVESVQTTLSLFTHLHPRPCTTRLASLPSSSCQESYRELARRLPISSPFPRYFLLPFSSEDTRDSARLATR